MRILLVEDSAAQARFIQHALSDASLPARFEVAWAETLGQALDLATSMDLDLILLDLLLPDSEGLDTFSTIRAAQPEVPVIVLSGTGDESVALQAVAAGAQDYLPKKSMSPDVLLRSIHYAVERERNLQGLRRVALSDDLTGVYNRRGFLLLADKHLAVARRTGLPIAILFVDVDGLKGVNDTYGHDSGDQALADVARLMVSTFRTSDVVGRIGGDEFCALLVTNAAEPSLAVARLNRAIEEHNASAGRPFVLSCSVGAIAHQPHRESEVADLLARADRAMYDARSAMRRPLILIVEDDAVVRRIYETQLSEHFDLVSADTGRAAVELARKAHPSLILLDMRLPDMDGQEIMTEFRAGADTRSIPVIVVTSLDDEAAELASFRAGVEAFLVKPVDRDDLRRAVERALDRSATSAINAGKRFNERHKP